MELTPTEKLLKKNFGITRFKQVIAKLEKEPEETFSQYLFVEKDVFISKIKELNNSINSLSEAYAEGLKMAESGSIFETFARRELGNIHKPYVQMRRQMVHHLSYFYKKK
ncbi:MAG: hypothetical protein PHP99_02090 [Paludibacter sp.]|nr:hypothetical protein [Paludibacter sp.]